MQEDSNNTCALNEEEMLTFADRMSAHLDDRLCPYSRNELRSRAWMDGYLFAKQHNVHQTTEKPYTCLTTKTQDATTTEKNVYVDLGLPSGTLWKNTIEEGYYTYDEALEKYGGNLPSQEQFQELIDNCTWIWDDDKKGYDIMGENLNSIFLPAAGYRNVYGSVNDVGSRGRYWSSTPSGSSCAMHLGFNSGYVGMFNFYRCYGKSVILCKSK